MRYLPPRATAGHPQRRGSKSAQWDRDLLLWGPEAGLPSLAWADAKRPRNQDSQSSLLQTLSVGASRPGATEAISGPTKSGVFTVLPSPSEIATCAELGCSAETALPAKAETSATAARAWKISTQNYPEKMCGKQHQEITPGKYKVYAALCARDTALHRYANASPLPRALDR